MRSVAAHMSRWKIGFRAIIRSASCACWWTRSRRIRVARWLRGMWWAGSERRLRAALLQVVYI